MTTNEWVPFTSRYGLRPHIDAWGRETFVARHTHTDQAVPLGQCETDGRLRCACPGGAAVNRAGLQCCQRATQEDRLCDQCREWCWAIDGARVYHRFIDLYGAQDPVRR